jgi:hypothetical protein
MHGCFCFLCTTPRDPALPCCFHTRALNLRFEPQHSIQVGTAGGSRVHSNHWGRLSKEELRQTEDKDVLYVHGH